MNRGLVLLAAAASAIASLLHGWVTPEHLSQAPRAGVFFLLVTVAQAAYAAMLLDRPGSPRLLVLGLTANLELILLLVWAHTLGLPGGAMADWHATGLGEHAERFSPAAVATLLAEGVLVVALGGLLRPRRAVMRLSA
jgi:hypothetical protein